MMWIFALVLTLALGTNAELCTVEVLYSTNIQTHGLRKLNKKLIECYMVCYMVLCVFGLLQER
jgi:hypothetical protein